MLAPPRTRGWTYQAHDIFAPESGSPAHAGMDRDMDLFAKMVQGLPRARGDGPVFTCSPVLGKKAPPRTRGWTSQNPCIEPIFSGSPAHAGMDPSGRLA